MRQTLAIRDSDELCALPKVGQPLSLDCMELVKSTCVCVCVCVCVSLSLTLLLERLSTFTVDASIHLNECASTREMEVI